MKYKGRIELGDSISFTAHDEATEKALYDSFKIKSICKIADKEEADDMYEIVIEQSKSLEDVDKENQIIIEKVNEFIKYNPTPHKIDGRIDFKRIYGAFGKDSYKAIKRLSREGYFN